MEKPTGYTALFDASVLFTVFTADLLLWLATTELFRPKWTADIHREWISSRLKRYPDAKSSQLQGRQEKMDLQFEDCLVTGYEQLIESLSLPDPGDRHVLAAAIACGADVIVTSNLKHFPESALSPFRIASQHPDDFIVSQIGLNSDSARLVAIAACRHKKKMTKSRPTWKQYFQKMQSAGVNLPKSNTEFVKPEFKALLVGVLRTGDWLPD